MIVPMCIWCERPHAGETGPVVQLSEDLQAEDEVCKLEEL